MHALLREKVFCFWKLLGKRGKKHDYDNEEDEREEAKEGKLEEKKARREWIKNDLE